MASFEITLPSSGRPRTASVALPSLEHRDLDELSNLAHGYFQVKDSATDKVAPAAVNDFLKEVLGGNAPKLQGDVSPRLFALVLSSGLYAARLKMADAVAQRHDLSFLSTQYNDLYRLKMAQVLHEVDVEAGTKLSQQQIQLNGFARGTPVKGERVLRHAYTFFGRHWNTLRQIAGLEPMAPEKEKSEEVLPASQQPKGHNQVHVTFDDGPGPWTGHILTEILKLEKEKNAKLPVTFFVTGHSMDALENGEGVVKRASELGHEIASHTHSHAFDLGGSPSEDVLAREVDAPQNRLTALLNKPVKHFRFPGGIFSLKSLLRVFKRGMRHVDWSVDTGDYHLAQQTAFEHRKENNQALINAAHTELIERVKTAKPGDVILMHDSEVLQPEAILSVPLTFENQAAQEADKNDRELRAKARGMFLAENLGDVVDALHGKKLALAPLPDDLRLYSRSYLNRLGLKFVQSLPGIRGAQRVARKAVYGAKKFAGDFLMKARGRKR